MFRFLLIFILLGSISSMPYHHKNELPEDYSSSSEYTSNSIEAVPRRKITTGYFPDFREHFDSDLDSDSNEWIKDISTTQ
ncbi:unnamed protein product [Caenorhabditis angaria]|uniref:Uncharacterized protein n=1 Tax=Caenorhabditis angaria TaxID=860376 RepID=A0A9P1MUC6_9PELO|nr:unnamed protein product [Caenorhabditis angaria]